MLLGPVQRVLVRLHLSLQTGEDLQVALGLGRQLAQMLIFEDAQFCFLRRQFCARLDELVFEEAGRVLRALLPLLEVLRDEQVRELACRLLRHLRIATRIINIERGKFLIVAVCQFDFDVLAHRLDHIVRALALALSSVETKTVNDSEKARAAQDLLCVMLSS